MGISSSFALEHIDETHNDVICSKTNENIDTVKNEDSIAENKSNTISKELIATNVLNKLEDELDPLLTKSNKMNKEIFEHKQEIKYSNTNDEYYDIISNKTNNMETLKNEDTIAISKQLITTNDLNKLEDELNSLMTKSNEMNQETFEHKQDIKYLNTNDVCNNNIIILDINNDYSDQKRSDTFNSKWSNGDSTNEDWGDLSLNYDGQQRIEHKSDDINYDNQYLLKIALERRRKSQADLSKFWECGKCSFLNHPSRAICMACYMPQTDIIHYILKSDMKNEIKTCPNCNAYIIPEQYVDHLTDCKPIYKLYGDTKDIATLWYVKLTKCEKNAITHVQSAAMQKSSNEIIKKKLMNTIYSIDNKYDKQTTLNKLHNFIEWTVPIIIRIHCVKLIPLLFKDTHYRNLFEIGTGSGNTNQKTRSNGEEKLFGPVYNNAKPFERPKYGCLNVGLQESGVRQAIRYGDGYFLMNDTTVRWRTTITIIDSLSSNAVCATLKHCDHLLTELNKDELQELIEAALYSKKGGAKQRTYREIQIHGPVQLNRDVVSLHIPNKHKSNKSNMKMFQQFCDKNQCKLVWF